MSQEKLNKSMKQNIPQLIFVVGLVVWVVSSIISSSVDVLTWTFNNKTSSSAFVVCLLMVGYLQLKKVLSNRTQQQGEKKKCTKCGKK